MDEPNLSYEDEVFENSFEDNVGLDDMLLDDPNQGFPSLENKENEDNLDLDNHVDDDGNACRDNNEFTTCEIFKSKEDMDSWTRQAGKRNDLVIVIKSSNGRIHRKRPTVVYSCERGGKFRERKKSNDILAKKRRQCGTKKCECPFSLRGKMNREGTGRELKVEYGVHNHSAAAYLVGHTYAGRLNEEERSILVEMSRSLARPKNILSTIKKRDECNASTLTHIFVYSCERGGKFRERKKSNDILAKKRRQCGTKKCECPFSLRGKMNGEETGWELKVENGVHNHSVVASLVGHTYAGRLNEEERRILVEMSRSLVRPKNILSTIKKRDEFNANTLMHIYNGRYRMRSLNMDGRTQMQYLMAKLAEHKYIERHRSTGGGNDELIDLVWTHPTSIELLRTFPHVLIMDATYKTNKYKLSLFEIIGETSTGMTFMVAFAYLNFKHHDNYHWVLSSLKTIMHDSHDIQPPKVVVTDREVVLMKAIGDVWSDKIKKNLLCRWHINNNITKQCKGQFHSAKEWEEFIQDWGVLVQAPTQAKY